MKNPVINRNQISDEFSRNQNYRIYGLVIILCLFACFNLEIHGQLKQKSKPKDAPAAQTKTSNSNQSSDNQKTDGQNKIGKITVKEDEFASKKTTALTEHSLSPVLTITLKCVIDIKANRTPMEKYLDFATVEFTSTSGKVEYLHAREINFLVDGKSVRGNQINSFINQQKGVENVITTLGFDVLMKISQGSEVKMKLGENVFVLDADFKKLVKEFIDAAQ